MHGLGQIFSAIVELLVRHTEGQLGRALGVGNVVKDKAHAVQCHLLLWTVNESVGLQNTQGAVDQVFAQAVVHVALDRARQIAAELVDRSTHHADANQHVFAGGLLQETRRCNHGHLALGDLLGADDAQRTTKMVRVCVREDHGRHRLVAQMLTREGQSRCRALTGSERIDHDPAGPAFDEGHVGHVKATQLINPVDHLEQAGVGIELGVAPQAGIDRVGGLSLEKSVGIKIFEQCAVRGHDLARGFSDETALGIPKVLLIVELEFLRELGIGLERGRCSVSERSNRIAASGASRQQCDCGDQAGQDEFHVQSSNARLRGLTDGYSQTFNQADIAHYRIAAKGRQGFLVARAVVGGQGGL